MGEQLSEGTATTRAWQQQRFAAWFLSAAIFLAPIATSWLAVRLLSSRFFQPDGFIGLVFWAAQAVVVAVLVSFATQRIGRQLVPLTFLLRMTLVFPDHAPSRFKVALRSGTLNRIRRPGD